MGMNKQRLRTRTRATMDDKGLYAGLMRLHILHEAEQQVVCGV
jgi:hypothetical protein